MPAEDIDGATPTPVVVGAQVPRLASFTLVDGVSSGWRARVTNVSGSTPAPRSAADARCNPSW
jgi:hypothetical protein